MHNNKSKYKRAHSGKSLLPSIELYPFSPEAATVTRLFGIPPAGLSEGALQGLPGNLPSFICQCIVIEFPLCITLNPVQRAPSQGGDL